MHVKEDIARTANEMTHSVGVCSPFGSLAEAIKFGRLRAQGSESWRRRGRKIRQCMGQFCKVACASGRIWVMNHNIVELRGPGGSVAGVSIGAESNFEKWLAHPVHNGFLSHKRKEKMREPPFEYVWLRCMYQPLAPRNLAPVGHLGTIDMP
jgi:hypothetical protein